MKNYATLAHWASKCASICTINKNRYYLFSIILLLTLGTGTAWGAEATLSFASTAQRVSQTTIKQVWSNGGITFTNNKASSTTNVANYSNPVRLYANSEVIVEHTLGKMTKIVFDCNSTTYANDMKTSIGTVSGATVTVSSDKVTVTFTTAVESFTVAKLTAQVRIDSITVTYEEEVTCKEITPSLTYSSTTLEIGSTANPILTGNTGNGTVSYLSSNSSVASVNATTGVVTANAAGTATITATIAANGDYCAGVATATIKVNKQSATIVLSEAGTENTVSGTFYKDDSYTLPSSTDAKCGDKVLVGWSTIEIAETDTKPTSNYYDKGTSVSLKAGENKFYTVFATESEITGGTTTTPTTASLSFASTEQRTSYSTSEQVWEQNGITLTNDKGSSTSNVGDYFNPARFYKSSKITVAAPGNITKIVFNCVSGYVISINDASTSGTTVTVTLNGTSNTYTVNPLSAQVRLNSVKVTYNKTTTGGTIVTYSDYTTQCITKTSVTLNPNGGTFASDPEGWTKDGNNYKKEGVTGAITLPTPTKTGYNFDGWYDGETKVNSPYTPSETVTLVAKWIPITYTIIFDKNNASATGTMSNQKFDYGTAQNLTQNAFILTGYTFSDWNTKEDGSGTSYSDKQSVNNLTTTNNATITLYAQWEINTYKVTFEANGGTGSMSTQIFTHGQEQALNANSFTRDHYTFNGWKDGNDNTYTDKQSITLTANLTLYAQWMANTYTITFNAGNGECVTGSATTTNVGGVTLPTATHTCPDWTFAGWWTEEVLSTNTSPGTLMKEGDTYKPTSDITLYAVYSTQEAGDAFTGYAKVTTAPDDWSGKYLLSTETYTANGTYDSNGANGHLVRETYTPGNEEKADWEFTLAKVGNTGYSILFPDGSFYLGYASSTNFQRSFDDPSENVAYLWTPSISGISNVSATTRKIADNGSADFRPYSSPSSGIVYLYKRVGGGSTTIYNSNPTCLVPVWKGATIDKTTLTVNCGERSPMTGANGAAKITFPTDKIYNFTSAITIEATTGFLVSTSQSVDTNYQSSVSLSPLVGTTNANTFYEKPIYVRAEAPAMSEEDLSGTITIKNNKGETLQTFSVTADVTCNKCTVQFVDRGANYQEPILLYAGQTIDEAPADPEGVCTDPIHYVFDDWAEATVAAGATTYTKVTFPYTVTGNTKFYAVYRYASDGGEPSNDFIKVTKEKDDWTGDYVIVNEDAEKAIGNAYQNTNTLKAIDVTITDNKVVSPSNDIIWQIRKHGENYTMYNASANKYAYIAKADAKGAGLSATTTNTTQDMQIVFNNGTAKVSGVDVYRCFYYYGTNTEWRTYATGSYNTGALYCRSLETYLYTTSPICGPYVEITSGKDIYVTGGNAGGTHDLVVAQQKVAYQATRLKKDNETGNLPSIQVRPANITYDATKTKNVTITFDEDSVRTLQSDDTYTISGTMTISYRPETNNVTDDIQVVLNANYNPSADVSNASFTVHARSLPQEFVIVAKQGDKWYALNGDMSNGSSANPANGHVVVDDNENPTKATYAPCNTIYTFDGLPNTGDRKFVRFQGTDGAWLWAASGTNVGIQNKSLKNTPSGNMEESKPYNWEIETENNITYFFHNANSSRVLRLNDGKFGMYVSGTDVIRILPYEAKCLYNYAPSNLKVSELKSTYVTLVWDAVAGATKYQYSSDATNWTDAGTEPTVTISGLSNGRNYTYYIRAYHADSGVSQECFDYSEVTFTTANCDDVPTDISYTADLNSIAVSWTASAASATIKLYSDENGEHPFFTQSGATSPWKISSLTKNTTYYLQIFSNGTCASPIIPVKTEDIKVDVVEWQPQGIVVDINTNETVGVTLENEVSYGSGSGADATELFFSKYYEATGNVKLVAIYNGTKNIIDLTDYEIHYGKDSWESQHITLKDFGETKGQIQPGEELILYTTNESDDDNKILDCVNKEYPDGKWVRVTQTNNDGKGHLSFAGNKTLVLKKDGVVIDVIGALTSAGNPTSTKAKDTPSWGDAAGWYCATGLSIADDTQIGISTNRCLLIRNNTVTSGANAVTSNIDDFVTLCSEWKGAQVPDNNVDNGVAASCENFAYVGTFDYSDYYTQFETMGEEQTFDENARNEDGTVTVEIPDLYKQSCRNIRITLEDKDGNVLSNREYKVPIMITTTQGTDGQAFIDLRHNLATKIDDGNGGLIDQDLTYEEVLEICKTCDVVIRDNATLQKMADDAENDHPQVHDVYVYENSSLVVPNGTNYTINNLSLRRKGDEVASLNVYPGALKLPESVAAPISLDVRVDAQNWHWFTLPYNCNISEVTWIDGSPAQYNVDWFLMTYDGESRSKEQSHYENHWKQYFGTTIEAGKGYIVGITGDLENPAFTYELRFPMAKEVLENENKDKTVDVRAWGVEDDIRPNKKGWNLIGNPYLAYYQRDNVNSFGGLRLGELIGPDPQTGLWEQTGNLPYVVVPVEGGWVSYEQLLVSETDLLPFTAYFVQVGNDGTHESTQDLKVSFDHTKLQLSATPMPASLIQRTDEDIDEKQEPVIVGVTLSNSIGESDKTSLVIDQQYTDEYEMNADFSKWFGDYYTYYTKPVLYTIGAGNEKLAFNALSKELASQPIAMGMYAAKAGEYTFTLDLRSDLSRVEEVWLHDATENIYTNLLQDSYTFSTSKVNGEGRFFLSVKMKPAQEPEPDPTPDPDPTPEPDPTPDPKPDPNQGTNLDNIATNQVWATVKDNVIYVNGLLSSAQLWIYDAAGKLLHQDQTQYYQHTYIVPQGGAYFVRVQSTMQTQTIKVVVK